MIADSFVPGKGILYRFDPRMKLLCLLFVVLAFFIESSLPVKAGLLAIFVLLTGTSLGAGKAAVPFKLIWPILVLTAILTPPFNLGGEVLLSLKGRPVLTSDGLEAAAAMLLRFSGITAAFFLFFSTTETSAFILALRSFGLPYKAALTVTISLRYIPDMFRVYGNISDAHKLRSAGIMQGGRRRGFQRRLAHLFPVLISVLIQAVKSIPALAMALDSKGFGRQNPRTSCRKLPHWSAIKPDIAGAAAVIALTAFVIVLL
ncbi:MAG: energy-coupling factor transporter transmembrane protein EcfT [Spirochaetales bacterium]|nr:energy-coupling factor transporter transmembrane protein EcfT [Spirochaetales bacterium]